MATRYALLIGFVYPNSNRKLLGSLVDLYRIYTLLIKNGFSEIDIITDLTSDPITSDYRQVIIDGYVNANLLSFISEIKKQGKHHPVESGDNLKIKISSLLAKACQGKTSLVIAITGHGDRIGFICPKDVLSWEDLHTSIFTSVNKYCQIMMIVDACHGWHFQLPYVLSKDKESYIFIGTSFFPACHLTLIVTESDEAVTTIYGSLVIKSLVDLLDRGYDRYFLLESKIQADLKATESLRSMQLKVGIYSTYPTLYRVWSWLWNGLRPIYPCRNGLFIEIKPN